MSAQLLSGILPANARVIVEIPWGANLNADSSNWPLSTPFVDITSDLWQEDSRITISPMGRSERFNQAQPAGCTFVLDNTTGKYGKGPASSNYPFVRPNTPVRINVTLNGITMFTRFFGYIEAWEPHDDETAKTAWVNVTAWGKMHTLDLKAQPVTNLLSRYHVRNGAAAVWGFDDGPTATQAANAVPNGPPMLPVALSAFTTFGHDASTALPAAGTTCTMDNTAAPGQDVFAGAVNTPLSGLLHIDLWRKEAPAPDASETQLLFIDLQGGSASLANIEIRARMSQISPLVKAGYIVLAAGSAVMDSATGSPGSTMSPFDGAFHNVHVTLQQISGNVQATLFVDGTNVDSHTFSSSTLPPLLTTVHVRNAVVAGAGIGNFDEQSAIAINTTAAGAPSFFVSARYLGETATDRLIRLCGEEGLGVPLLLTGTSNMLMGVQKPGTLPDLLRECESVDQGVLYDGVSQGLAYVARSSKYNQAATLTLDASAGQLDPPFEPKDQDPQRRNLWVIGRRDGSTATVTDKTGPLGTDAIGPLSRSVSDLNLASDAELANIGGWLLRLGTVNEPYYYPTLKLDLSAIPSKAFDWLSTGIGERIDITNLSTVSSRHPPGTVALILEGYTEILSPYEWTVQANCSPATPWNADSLNNAFRLELAGQTLAAQLAPGATSLSLATASGHQLFTTTAAYPADFPLDLIVSGWPIHVTAASGGSSPQTLTISTSPNLTTISTSSPVSLYRPAALAL